MEREDANQLITLQTLVSALSTLRWTRTHWTSVTCGPLNDDHPQLQRFALSVLRLSRELPWSENPCCGVWISGCCIAARLCRVLPVTFSGSDVCCPWCAWSGKIRRSCCVLNHYCVSLMSCCGVLSAAYGTVCWVLCDALAGVCRITRFYAARLC